MSRRICSLVAALTALVFAASTGAQQVVYPAKGQSPEQQKKDESECHQWAVKQTGIDPTKQPAQTTTSQPNTTATGTTRGAGARGAARGAIVAEAVGGDASSGAAAGAAAGRAQSRRQNTAAAQQQQQAATQQTQQNQAAYGKARAACLEGRGYTVK
jgi:hypothetical protein